MKNKTGFVKQATVHQSADLEAMLDKAFIYIGSKQDLMHFIAKLYADTKRVAPVSPFMNKQHIDGFFGASVKTTSSGNAVGFIENDPSRLPSAYPSLLAGYSLDPAYSPVSSPVYVPVNALSPAK